jgi:pterin-4a-carbinolamine dehydratase
VPTVALLSPDEITKRLETLNGWSGDAKAIRKEFDLQDFP